MRVAINLVRRCLRLRNNTSYAARSPGADRHDKALIYLALEGAHFRAYSQQLNSRSGSEQVEKSLRQPPVELAQRRNLPLTTLDRELRAAAKSLGLRLMGMQ